MKRWVTLCFIAGFPFLTQAADDPVDVLKADQYDAATCVQKAAESCVNTMCMNSPDIDCPDHCQSEAQAQCREAASE